MLINYFINQIVTKMKKVFSILMAALFATAMFSCSKDAEDLIIGTWEETEATYTENVNGEVREFSMLEPGETTTITFKDDHTYISVYHSNDGDSEEDRGTWSVDGDKLIIGDGEDTMAYNIDNIDKKSMTISYSESEAFEGNSYSASIVIKMKRI